MTTRLGIINSALSRLAIRPLGSTADSTGLGGACLSHFNSAWVQFTSVLRKRLHEIYEVQLADWQDDYTISVPNRWQEIHSVYLDKENTYFLQTVTEDEYACLKNITTVGNFRYVLVRDLETILVYPAATENDDKTSFRVRADRTIAAPVTDSAEFTYGAEFDEALTCLLCSIISMSYLADTLKYQAYMAQYTKLLRQYQARSSDPVRAGRSFKMGIPGRS